MNEMMHVRDGALAVLAEAGGASEVMEIEGYYEVECLNPDGTLAWRDTIKNLVPTAGKNFALDTLLAGSAYTAAFYMGLVDGASAPTFNAADTAASHAGWAENQAYVAGVRPSPSFSAAGAGVKATSAAVSFTANAAGTIAGCFIASSNVKGGASGVLLSCGAFAGGSQAVTSGSVINVSYSLSV